MAGHTVLVCRHAFEQVRCEPVVGQAIGHAAAACGREVLVGCRKADHGIKHGALADFLLQEACVTREAEVVPTDCAPTVRAASDGHRPDKGRGRTDA